MKNITVVGAGANGLATAAWLAFKGFPVCLYECEEEFGDLHAIKQRNGILVRGNGDSGCFMPALLSTSLSEAVSFGDIILYCTSAGRHEEVIAGSLPYIRSGQLLLFNPGNFGSVQMRRALTQKAPATLDVLTADFSSCLWACRRTDAGEVTVAFRLESPKRLSAFPAKDTQKVLSELQGILPVEASTNVLEAVLNSPNVVSHVGGAILNAVQIEKMGNKFAYYLDGLEESVIRLTACLEEERNGVLRALSLAVYSESSEAFTRSLMAYGQNPDLDVFRSLGGPDSLNHRYVTEDAACGVSMLVSLGQRLGVNVSVTLATLQIAGALLKRDFMREGLTLEKLGITGTTAQQILDAF